MIKKRYEYESSVLKQMDRPEVGRTDAGAVYAEIVTGARYVLVGLIALRVQPDAVAHVDVVHCESISILLIH